MAGAIERADLPQGRSGEMHSEAVAAWSASGVVSAADKHVVEAAVATELGVRVEGKTGLQRFEKLAKVTMILLGHRCPPTKFVQSDSISLEFGIT